MTTHPDIESCNCEHVEHETPLASQVHAYMAVPAGNRRALFVGRVCDDCADGHYADVVEGQS